MTERVARSTGASNNGESPTEALERPAEPPAPPAALVDRPRVKTFLAIAGFCIALAGFAVVVWVNFIRSEASDGSTPPSSAALEEDTPSTDMSDTFEPTTGSTDAAVGVGQCFTTDWARTGCDALHQYELIASEGPCTTDQALAYLGGISGVDVLRADIAPVVRRIDGRDACALGLSEDARLTHSVRDVLQQRSGDVWRRCIDDRTAREVPCSLPHTAEVVGPASSDDLNCAAQADTYAETSLARFSLDLFVTSRGPEGAQQCVVEKRGQNVLTRSLRHLGSDALPIASD